MALLSIYIGGIFTLVMAVVHTRYFKYFRWKAEFRKITELNTKVFYTIHLALLLLFFVLGTITLVYADFLSECSGMALGFNLGISLIWFWRVVWQIFYFKSDKAIYYLFMFHFFLTGVAYLIPVLNRFLN